MAVTYVLGTNRRPALSSNRSDSMTMSYLDLIWLYFPYVVSRYSHCRRCKWERLFMIFINFVFYIFNKLRHCKDKEMEINTNGTITFNTYTRRLIKLTCSSTYEFRGTQCNGVYLDVGCQLGLQYNKRNKNVLTYSTRRSIPVASR